MSCDQLRRSTLATLTEIVEGERAFKERHGIDIRDACTWMRIGDIVARIERRLAASIVDAERTRTLPADQETTE